MSKQQKNTKYNFFDFMFLNLTSDCKPVRRQVGETGVLIVYYSIQKSKSYELLCKYEYYNQQLL